MRLLSESSGILPRTSLVSFGVGPWPICLRNSEGSPPYPNLTWLARAVIILTMLTERTEPQTLVLTVRARTITEVSGEASELLGIPQTSSQREPHQDGRSDPRERVVTLRNIY